MIKKVRIKETQGRIIMPMLDGIIVYKGGDDYASYYGEDEIKPDWEYKNTKQQPINMKDT